MNAPNAPASRPAAPTTTQVVQRDAAAIAESRDDRVDLCESRRPGMLTDNLMSHLDARLRRR